MQIGRNFNGNASQLAPAPGFIDLFDSSVLKATGAASYEKANISPILGTGTVEVPAPSNITLQTVNASDTLSIKASLKQFDPNTAQNDANFDVAAGVSYNNITVHFAGPGRVILQDGGVSSRTTFGGSWSVEGGTLQVGPFVANPTPDFISTSTTGWAVLLASLSMRWASRRRPARERCSDQG